MELSIQIESKDYIRAQFLHLRPRPVIKILGILLLVLLLVVLGIITLHYLESGEDLGMLLLFLAGISYFPILFFVWLPLKAKRTYNQMKLLREAFLFRITDENLYSKAGFGESTLQWKTFHKWKENKNLFLIYQADNLFHIFPKRFFPSAEATNELRTILQKNLGKAKT